MLRAFVLLSFLFVVGWPSVASAARESGPSSGGIFVNPLGLVYGPTSVEFDYGLGTQASLNFDLSHWSSLGAGGTGALGIGVGPQLFATGPIYGGVFVYPSVGLLWLSFDETTEAEAVELTVIAPRLLLGYQWDWKVVSLRLGLGGYFLIPRDPPPDRELEVEGLRLALDLSFGVTF